MNPARVFARPGAWPATPATRHHPGIFAGIFQAIVNGGQHPVAIGKTQLFLARGFGEKIKVIEALRRQPFRWQEGGDAPLRGNVQGIFFFGKKRGPQRAGGHGLSQAQPQRALFGIRRRLPKPPARIPRLGERKTRHARVVSLQCGRRAAFFLQQPPFDEQQGARRIHGSGIVGALGGGKPQRGLGFGFGLLLQRGEGLPD